MKKTLNSNLLRVSSLSLLLCSSASFAVTQEQIQNYINNYNGNYDVEKIKADAATYGVSYEQVMEAVNNAPKPVVAAPAAMPVATPAPAAQVASAPVATTPVVSVADQVAASGGFTYSKVAVEGELQIDKIFRAKTDALSQGQLDELAKIRERRDPSKYTDLDEAAQKRIQEASAYEQMQIASLTPAEFAAWKEYQTYLPNQEYLNSGSSWVVNPNFDPCYEIRNNKNGANTAANMAECSKKSSASSAASGTGSNSIVAERPQLTTGVNDSSSIGQYSQSAQTMLIAAAEKYAKNEITKEQFIDISISVSKALKYSRSVSSTSN